MKSPHPTPKADPIINDLTALFCVIDDYCQQAKSKIEARTLSAPGHRKGRPSEVTTSEVMTLQILFHLSNYRTFKHFYKDHVQKHLSVEFPRLVSYTRMVELLPSCLPYVVGYLFDCGLGKVTGISFIDSTCLEVCDLPRSSNHRVFDGAAAYGKTSLGWFFGFKLHLVINHQGEIVAVAFSAGNVHDSNKDILDQLTRHLWGILSGDKAYISSKWTTDLMQRGIRLVTSIRKNMKNKLVLIEERIVQKGRTLIESVNNLLKNQCQIEHTRHRSPWNFLTNLFSGLVAYSFFPSKPTLRGVSVIGQSIA